MDRLKTAGNKIFDSDYLATIPSPQQAYIRILNTDIDIVAKIFSNPSETIQIWYGQTYLAGYTHLVAIIPENNAIKVVLSKE